MTDHTGMSAARMFRQARRDNVPAHIITHERREYDLTALETPFGILQEKAPPVAEALKAWPHGLELYSSDASGRRGAWVDMPARVWDWHTVRAKPAPVEERVSCYRGILGVGGKYGTCIKRADGSIDWTTWEPEA